jgi:mono/diheme cytochrome c family protein
LTSQGKESEHYRLRWVRCDHFTFGTFYDWEARVLLPNFVFIYYSNMNIRFTLLALFLLPMITASFAQQEKSDLTESIARGKEIYSAQCMSCHMDEGQGIEDVYPPLAKSDYLLQDKARSINSVLHGVTGEIVVNGKTYNMDMTPFNFLTDQEVSDVLNYIRNSWGNTGEAVTPVEVSAARK